jgi:hypothetical protein
MRGWSSIVVGVGLLALAFWAFQWGVSSGAVILFFTAGLFLVFRGWQGLGVTQAGDPSALADFVSNPGAAIVDAVVDQAGEWLTDKNGKQADEKPAFDADAAFARYMAARPATSAVETQAAPVRGFGRKGL